VSRSKENKPTAVTILGEEYMVACAPDEEEDLVASAQYLHQKMREIRTSGRIISNEHVAVMAALNITHEMLQARAEKESVSGDVAPRLRVMREKVEAALNDSNQLEL
jgi:cell division protein ZapA